ncbi:lysylphosphatidylglycerol synthase domain-containing protein [Alsobacter soli]|uniref:lysylphosphatidylglycerol synthase domain-containing protein n=1 Tax=Alsobacter soli TaxID=2109933 RepID=UPI001FE09218|nr:lysylphosphatidylglycerol synthase domain-containing protein [Alsobacter soli]
MTPTPGPRGRWAWIGTAASVLLFVISAVVLWRIMAEVKLSDVRDAFARADLESLAIAAGFVTLSYTLLTGYDALALRQLKLRIPYRVTALGSFTSYAISFTLGFPLVTAATVRYWIYAPLGVSAGKVASLTTIAGLTFLLGMGTVVGLGLVWQAPAIADINNLAVFVNRWIGAAVLALIVGYLAWVAVKRRAVRVQRWRLELPSFKLSLGQIVLGAAEVCCASAVLYVLMPPGYGVEFQTLAAIYAFACILGMVSHAPGGLGVFESTMLLAFWRLPYGGMIGALLLFRICYYLVPFVVALALLGAMEIVRRVKAFRADDGEDEDEIEVGSG